VVKKNRVKKIGKGLAGALAIANGTTAYGAIRQVFPPPNLTNVPGGTMTTRSWDVNGDGINVFTFTNRYPNTPPGGTGVIWQLNIFPLANNGVVSYLGPNIRYAFALGAGEIINSSSPGISQSANQQVALGSKYSYGSMGVNYYGGFAAGGPNGSVHPGTFAFVGFRFQAADGQHYGWLRLSVNAGIIDFHTAAYEDTPNTMIGTSVLDPLVPEPGTLALLAFGAVGVIGAGRLRRKTDVCRN
jgi:hypothetical protein